MLWPFLTFLDNLLQDKHISLKKKKVKEEYIVERVYIKQIEVFNYSYSQNYRLLFASILVKIGHSNRKLS